MSSTTTTWAIFMVLKCRCAKSNASALAFETDNSRVVPCGRQCHANIRATRSLQLASRNTRAKSHSVQVFSFSVCQRFPRPITGSTAIFSPDDTATGKQYQDAHFPPTVCLLNFTKPLPIPQLHPIASPGSIIIKSSTHARAYPENKHDEHVSHQRGERAILSVNPRGAGRRAAAAPRSKTYIAPRDYTRKVSRPLSTQSARMIRMRTIRV